MKYCKNCRFYRDHPANGMQRVCGKFSTTILHEDPVEGPTELHARAYCRIEREAGGKCGPDAKGFEQYVPDPADFKPKLVRTKSGWWSW